MWWLWVDFHGLMLVGYSSECGLIFMGCDGMMFVGYDGKCGLILLVRLILGFGYCDRW